MRIRVIKYEYNWDTYIENSETLIDFDLDNVIGLKSLVSALSLQYSLFTDTNDIDENGFGLYRSITYYKGIKRQIYWSYVMTVE